MSILIVPLLVYINYQINLEEAKTEVRLKKKALDIINAMELFGESNDRFFDFPRYKLYKAGLFDKDGNQIFSNIEKEILFFKEGYHKDDNIKRIYNFLLPKNRYFGAKYLVVETDFNIYIIIQNSLTILLSIFAITYFLSFVILKNFIKPFAQINKALDSFIKDSMHEINNPLSIINLNVDMFQMKHGNNRYLKRIKSASKILSSIYNDMNFLIKEKAIENAKKEQINFTNFVEKSIDYFYDIADLKGVTIISNVDDGIYLNFVPTKLQKIVDNNLSNAVKYSKEEGTVEVILRKDKRNNKIILIIKDDGIGIKDPDKIFSRYYREDEVKGGFGIGLNIVNRIINEEEIDVFVRSVVNEGTEFKYIFPIKFD